MRESMEQVYGLPRFPVAVPVDWAARAESLGAYRAGPVSRIAIFILQKFLKKKNYPSMYMNYQSGRLNFEYELSK